MPIVSLDKVRIVLQATLKILKLWLFDFVDDCSVILLYPFTCASDDTFKSCDIILQLNLIDSIIVNVDLLKKNVFKNSWISIGISNTENFVSFVSAGLSLTFFE